VPACDVIIDGSQVNNLANLIRYSRQCLRIIYFSFGFSVFYNLVGLSFAVTGMLSPVIAAVLMPVSSISIVVFTTILSKYYFDKTIK
jgi:Cu+-exporting ATPase